MLEWKDVKEAELGRTYEIKALEGCCRAVYGGVSWPGKRPGFAVVIAMGSTRHIDNHDVCLLDEFESFDIRELVRQCSVLDFKYLPGQWIGDWKNDAAQQFIQELQSENRTHNRQLNLSWTPMFDMEQFYPYILSEIRMLLAPDYRQLSLGNSKVRGYLSEVEGSEIADLERASYPAIEALAFAVIEMRRRSQAGYADDPRSLLVPDTIGV
ncbi:MAG: hypothetical protein ISS70_08245 [Phycisphaerae bacterium]|nr:hypothetical protein [Phycisphaerae bacterium]